MDQQELIYCEAETGISASGTGSIRADQFYGKSPIIAAREYLELRSKAVPLDDIYQGLIQGGFDFDAQGWGEAVRLRNLSISLGKNTAVFHRLPNDTIGLLKWYPEAKQRKAAAKGQQAADNAKLEAEQESEKTEPANNA